MILAFILIWIAFSFWHSSKNKYISKHKGKFDNDKQYSSYLLWCLEVGEIPMNKIEYIKEIEDKENEYKNLIK